ncbi:hypothetical protein MUK42_12349 [Musa troglodytarum]|uniref:Methionyl-tRNA synthetase n=1 Tax=Musa troglodytarum TaxID=320322 RepID=A0A9E7GRI9_9LILI|nr:hypothetical protein MUK42_12349 [Musa troglodytarum]
MCLVLLCDEEQRVLRSFTAPGSCPYCGGKVVATDVESACSFCFRPLCFRTRRKFICTLCRCRLVSLPTLPPPYTHEHLTASDV